MVGSPAEDLIRAFIKEFASSIVVPLAVALVGSVTTIIGVWLTFRNSRKLEYEKRRRENLVALLKIVGVCNSVIELHYEASSVIKQTKIDRGEREKTPTETEFFFTLLRQRTDCVGSIGGYLAEAYALGFSLADERLSGDPLSRRVKEWTTACDEFLIDDSERDKVSVLSQRLTSDISEVLVGDSRLPAKR